MRKESIWIEYQPNLSVNHYLSRRRDGGYYVKPEVKDWKLEFGWLLKKLHLEDWKLPLQVKCDATFKDERSACDISNLSKICLDSIEEVTGINDSNFRWHDGDRKIDKNQEPHLLITISEFIPEPLPDAPKSKIKPIKVRTRGKLRDKKVQ